MHPWFWKFLVNSGSCNWFWKTFKNISVFVDPVEESGPNCAGIWKNIPNPLLLWMVKLIWVAWSFAANHNLHDLWVDLSQQVKLYFNSLSRYVQDFGVLRNPCLKPPTRGHSSLYARRLDFLNNGKTVLANFSFPCCSLTQWTACTSPLPQPANWICNCRSKEPLSHVLLRVLLAISDRWPPCRVAAFRFLPPL
jgi:hypothetical protein